jgi:hypothetical protein
MKFIPDESKSNVMVVPFFEDSSDEKVSGRGTTLTAKQLQTEIEDELIKLGARRVIVTEGRFDTKPVRYGYIVSFLFHDHEAQIEVAALPMRQATESKKDKALRQALYLLRNWLKAEREALLYRPTSQPLLPYVLAEGGERTLIQIAAERLGVPLMIGSGNG